MDFGLSLINCSKTAPFLTMVGAREISGTQCLTALSHRKWVSDHEDSTVGVGVGQSNDSFTYNKKELNPDFGLGFFYLKKAHNIHYVIFLFT